jgi:hypothetical protein
MPGGIPISGSTGKRQAQYRHSQVPGRVALEVRSEPHPGHRKTGSCAIMRRAGPGISPHSGEGVKVATQHLMDL